MNKLITCVCIVLSICGCSDKEVLHVYSWADYFSPEVIQRFEEENNCIVKIDTFDSNESMYAKLKAGGTGYDIITPTAYQMPSLVKEGIVDEIDYSLIKNVSSNYDHKYSLYVYDDSMKYSVPYSISYTGIMYTKQHVEKADTEDWGVYSNAKYHGKMMLLNDIREVIGIALMKLGRNVNTEDKRDIDDAVKLICSWKKHIRKMDSESYKTDVSSGSVFIGQGYSGDALQVILGDDENTSREDIGFALPTNGFIVSCDEFAIMKTSKNKELSHRFIDCFYETENCVDNMNYLYSFTPNKKALCLLKKDIRDIIIPSDEYLSIGHTFKSFDDKPDVLEMYNKAWDEITTYQVR